MKKQTYQSKILFWSIFATPKKIRKCFSKFWAIAIKKVTQRMSNHCFISNCTTAVETSSFLSDGDHGIIYCVEMEYVSEDLDTVKNQS